MDHFCFVVVVLDSGARTLCVRSYPLKRLEGYVGYQEALVALSERYKGKGFFRKLHQGLK